MGTQEFIKSVSSQRDGLFRQAMHYLGNASDAEDAVQETLLKLWTTRERITDATKMRNMASVICKHVALNMLRDARQTVQIETVGNLAYVDTPLIQLEHQESLRTLSDKHRAIIRMRNVENMPYADIAQILGTTESSVRGMISKARTELLKNLNKTKQ